MHMAPLAEFTIPMAALWLAEIGDKTQLAVLTLITKFKNKMNVFLGAMLALSIITALGVFFGSVVAHHVNPDIIKKISAAIFVGVGLWMWFSKENNGVKVNQKSAFISSFILIFVAELADRTNLAAAAFATQYNPWLVYFGSVVGLALVIGPTILFGGKILQKIKPSIVKKVSAAAFIAVGLVFYFF